MWWVAQITCVFSSQVFKLKIQNLSRGGPSVPEPDLDGEILDSETMLFWKETSVLAAGGWVYFVHTRDIIWTAVVGGCWEDCIFQQWPHQYTSSSHTLPKRWCWHTSTERWGLCSVHLNYEGLGGCGGSDAAGRLRLVLRVPHSPHLTSKMFPFPTWSPYCEESQATWGGHTWGL